MECSRRVARERNKMKTFWYPVVGTVYHAFSNAILAALMVVTYLWGGCISCDQFFMLPQSKADCCHKGACEKPTKDDPAKSTSKSCEKMPLDHQRSANPHGSAANSLIHLPSAEPPPFGGPLFLAWRLNAPPEEFQLVIGSPPDLRVLNSSFLI